MKHEREKEIIAGAAGITKELIRATGASLSGLLSNQIAGTAFFIVAATALYPEWFPLVEQSASKIAADIASAVHDNILPAFDITGPSRGLVQNPKDYQMAWGVGLTFFGKAGEFWYRSPALRDTAFRSPLLALAVDKVKLDKFPGEYVITADAIGLKSEFIVIGHFTEKKLADEEFGELNTLGRFKGLTEYPP